MTMTWDNRMDLTGIMERVRGNVEDALGEGAGVILDRADELAPKVSGALVASGHVDQALGGLNTVDIVYSSAYSHWVDMHDSFAHPHGGQARFLELALIEKGPDAINKAGETLMDRI